MTNNGGVPDTLTSNSSQVLVTFRANFSELESEYFPDFNSFITNYQANLYQIQQRDFFTNISANSDFIRLYQDFFGNYLKAFQNLGQEIVSEPLLAGFSFYYSVSLI